MELNNKELADALNFVNDFRKRKGADPLESLPGGIPGNSQFCILANAFNYGCQVQMDDGILFKTEKDARLYLEVVDIEVILPEHEDQWNKHDWSGPTLWKDGNPANPEGWRAAMHPVLHVVAENFDMGDYPYLIDESLVEKLESIEQQQWARTTISDAMATQEWKKKKQAVMAKL